MIQNIQTLFGTITATNVKTYLLARGWRMRENGERIDYDRLEPSGETRMLFLPKSEAHPRFRKLLPNVVFSLAVLESREALVIANEIFQSQEVVAPEPPAKPQSVSVELATAPHEPKALPRPAAIPPLRLRNRSAAPLSVHLPCAQESPAIPLSPYDELWIECSSGQRPLLLELEGPVKVLWENQSVPQVYWGPSIHASIDRHSVMEWFSKRSANLDFKQSDEKLRLAASVDATRQKLDRFFFAMGTDGLQRCDPTILLRSIAQLLCELGQLWEWSDAATDLLNLARQLLTPRGIVIMAVSGNAVALLDACRQDDPAAPLKTLAWLESSTHNVESMPNERNASPSKAL